MKNIFFSILCFFSLSAFSTTWTVDKATVNTGMFSPVTAAVDTASYGDTIMIHSIASSST